MADLAGRFQGMRDAKFDHDKSKWAFWMHMGWFGAYILFDTFLLISAALGLTLFNDKIWPFATWTWMLTGMTGFWFVWTMATVICALRNKWAVDRGEKELPCMEMYYTVSYSFFILAGWAVALGFMADLYAHRSVPDTNSQDESFETKLWIVVLVTSLNLWDPLRYIMGVARDKWIMWTKSTCFDA